MADAWEKRLQSSSYQEEEAASAKDADVAERVHDAARDTRHRTKLPPEVARETLPRLPDEQTHLTTRDPSG